METNNPITTEGLKSIVIASLNEKEKTKDQDRTVALNNLATAAEKLRILKENLTERQ